MQKIEIGRIYRHFKGNLYKITGFAKHSETMEDMIVYTPLKTGDSWSDLTECGMKLLTIKGLCVLHLLKTNYLKNFDIVAAIL